MSSLFSLASATVGGGHQGRSGYRMQRSVRLRSSASAYFNRTLGAGGGTTKNVFSAWVKRGALGVQHAIFQARQDASNQQYIGFTSGNTIEIGIVATGSTVLNKITTAVYRDPSAWYHIFFRQDNTLATAEDRYQLWINGVRVTAWATNTNTAGQGTAYYFGTANPHYIGAYGGTAGFLDGYITETNFVYQPTVVPDVTDFGETNPVTGVWQPKKYAGTYHTNGFYLNFSDNSAATAAAIGKDYSGNGNNWTPNNISVTAGVTYDSMLDVPTRWGDGGNGRGNYCTLNRLAEYGTIGQMGCANGNLVSSPGGSTTNKGFLVTTGIDVGMTAYAEATFTTTSGDNNGGVALTPQGNANPGDTATSMRWGDAGFIRTNNVGTAYGSALVTNDVVMMAVNYESATSCKVWIGKNGTWFASGNPATGANPSVTLNPAAVTMFIASYHFGNGAVSNWTFGQRPFSYTPPTGFKALNTLNLPTPTILKGNQYMNVLTWSGTGGSAGATRSLTGLGFQPDLVWEKDRASAQDHHLFDSVRGAGTSKTLASNSTGAEGGFNDTLYGYLSSFDADGFTTTNGSSTWDNWNKSGDTYVGWTWKKGATQGFDIVTFTNTASSAAFNHSLGVTPAMIILKGRGPTAANWTVFHKSLANMTSAYLNLNGTGATGTLATGVPAPTSTTFGSSSAAIPASESSIAYLFAEVAGFSKFGSYTGNGSADGPFVFCGFRPRWVFVKRTDSTGNWYLWDTARNTSNLTTQVLFPDLSAVESTYAATNPVIDILSNGFKQRGDYLHVNASGGTYIFAAFAEHPFKNALAR